MGDFGTILAYDGEWRLQESGVQADLLALARPKAFNPELIIAAGRSGTILRSTNFGETWTRIKSGVGADLHALSFFEFSSPEVIAVGGEGAVLKSSDWGLTWVPQVVPGPPGVFRGVATQQVLVGDMSRTEVLAVGDAGVAVLSVDGGLTWSPLDIGAEVDLRAVGGPLGYYEDARFVIYGEGGYVWVQQSEGPVTGHVAKYDSRHDFAGLSLNELWLVSSDGSVFLTGNTAALVRLTPDEGGKTTALLAIDGEDDNAIAVGESGTIARIQYQYVNDCP